MRPSETGCSPRSAISSATGPRRPRASSSCRWSRSWCGPCANNDARRTGQACVPDLDARGRRPLPGSNPRAAAVPGPRAALQLHRADRDHAGGNLPGQRGAARVRRADGQVRAPRLADRGRPARGRPRRRRVSPRGDQDRTRPGRRFHPGHELVMIRHFHQGTAVGSAVLTVFIGSGVIGTLGGGWLADHWQRVGTLRLCYALSAGAILLLIAAPDVTVLFIAASCLGIFLFAPFAVQVTLGQDFLPNRIGTASGVTLGLAVSAGGLAAPLFGLLADSYGLRTALGAIAAFPALACALTLLLRDPRPRSRRDGPVGLAG